MHPTTAAIDSLGDLIQKVKLIRSQWTGGQRPQEELWFRGQARLSDTLTPTLYRDASLRSGFHLKENSLLADFRLQAKSLTTSPSSAELEKWFWYVTARHHNLPSRLLDWSDNVLIALYFALESAWNSIDKTTWTKYRHAAHRAATKAEPPAIWVLEAASLNRASQGISAILSFETKEKCLPSYYPKPGLIKETKYNRYPIALYPARSTPRVHSQRSYFTLHGTDQRPLEFLARASRMARKSVLLARIPINPCRIPYLIDDLILCGIAPSTIYADLDSIAKTVKWSFMEQGSLDGKKSAPKAEL
jgi:hypothetical protein